MSRRAAREEEKKVIGSPAKIWHFFCARDYLFFSKVLFPAHFKTFARGSTVQIQSAAGFLFPFFFVDITKLSGACLLAYRANSPSRVNEMTKVADIKGAYVYGKRRNSLGFQTFFPISHRGLDGLGRGMLPLKIIIKLAVATSYSHAMFNAFAIL